VTDALYNAGFQSSSAAYAETVGQFRHDAHGISAAAATRCRSPTRARRARSLAVAGCDRERHLRVRLGDSEAELAQTLAEEFPAAALSRAEPARGWWLDALLAYLDGQQARLELPLDVRATASSDVCGRR